MNIALTIADPSFRAAVAAIDAGDTNTLRVLLDEAPALLAERAGVGEGYFERPYLLWFVAENPVRNGTLPPNIVDVAGIIIEGLQRHRVATRSEQIDGTLGLVASGRVARECRLQIPLIDRLAAAGASLDAALPPALAHRETAAVTRLLELGAAPTLASDAAVGTLDALASRIVGASVGERLVALVSAAVHGRADAIAPIAATGVDLDAYAPAGFHAHSTALHQAVAANSLAAVDALLAAGASRDVRDRVHRGTALDWARHAGYDAIAERLARL